jgi:hypothetical protein
MKRRKWLIYTVLVGLLPTLMKIFIAISDKHGSLTYCINEGDIVLLGLVLNLSNLNELEAVKIEDQQWKGWIFGISIIFIALFSAIYMLSSYADYKGIVDYNRVNIKVAAIFLSVVSFFLGLTLYNHQSKNFTNG